MLRGEDIVDIPGILGRFPCSHKWACCSVDTPSWLHYYGGEYKSSGLRVDLLFFVLFFTITLHTVHYTINLCSWLVYPRCCGKSLASSCWPSSSVLLFLDWLLVVFCFFCSYILIVFSSLVIFFPSMLQSQIVGFYKWVKMDFLHCNFKVTWKASPA